MRVNILSLFLLASASLLHAEADNSSCLKCHSMKNLQVQSGKPGNVQSFHIDNDDFHRSNHKSLACSQCHTSGYENYPHKHAQTDLDCITCHTQSEEFNTGSEERKLLLSDMKEIRAEYNDSVHRDRLGKNFACAHCHNPHNFTDKRILADQRGDQIPLKDRVNWSNSICMNCHQNEEKINNLKSKKYTYRPLEEIHTWLPATKLHWQKVRCVDCHADFSGVDTHQHKNTENPFGGKFTHRIFPKTKAVRDCQACHSTDTILNARMYQMNMRRTRDEHGFVNAILWNNAYIIGATRNVWLDRFSVSLLLFAIFGIGIHATFRILTHKKRVHNEEEKDHE